MPASIMDIEYMWIYRRQVKNNRQSTLLIWAIFIGQFVHPKGGGGYGVKGVNGGGDRYFSQLRDSL